MVSDLGIDVPAPEPGEVLVLSGIAESPEFPAIVTEEDGFVTTSFRRETVASMMLWLNDIATPDIVGRAYWDGAILVLLDAGYVAATRWSPGPDGRYVLGGVRWPWTLAADAPGSAQPDADDGYVPFFDVAAPYKKEHFLCGPGSQCHCTLPDTPEGEYLSSSPTRREQIKALLAAQGRAVVPCGPCNGLIFAVTRQEMAAFQHRHRDCEWDDHKNPSTETSGETYSAHSIVGETVGSLDLSALDGDGDMRYDDTPEANRHDNTRRAGLALTAVQGYASACNEDNEAPETVISDLLGDLRHLCNAVGLDFDALSDHGGWHYQAEVTGNWA